MDSNLPRPLPSAPLAGRQHPCRNLRQPSGSRSYSLFAAGPAGWIRGKRGPFLFANHPGPFLVPGTGRTNIDPAAVICKHHSPWLEAAQHRRPGPAWRLSRMEPAWLWLWLLGAGILASAHGDKSPGLPQAPRGRLSEPAPAYRQVTPTITSFALRVYKQLAAETPGNILFSPVSIASTLALLSLGAQADTSTQILQGLGFNLTETPQASIHCGFQSLIHALDLPSPKLELKVGHSLFLDKQLKPRQRFLDDIRELYGALAFSVNLTDSATAWRQMNDYVRKQTYGQVVDCLQEFSEDTPMVLLNYIFFKGGRLGERTWEIYAKWKHPFQRYQTQKQESFFVNERTSLHVPMMHQKEMHRFLYDQERACTVLQIEYSGNALALLILPDPGQMQQVEAALQPETLRTWSQLLVPRVSTKLVWPSLCVHPASPRS
ncbi:PREDICTED: serpin A11 isoform X5 [Myotis brandtii]|uniref:serpin A11 isoform X5 n=1 Tax=Myotis brandtii TaxID=109478 RepID=UPI000703EE19|nr:PREDICTED: serpin A11 isoform X5 [Myotis brandtii]